MHAKRRIFLLLVAKSTGIAPYFEAKQHSNANICLLSFLWGSPIDLWSKSQFCPELSRTGSESITMSVVGMVSYIIWSYQDMAWTCQSKIVFNDISHCIYAQHDAVLWVLQEGSIQRVSKSVLALHFHYYALHGMIIRKIPPSKQQWKYHLN
jgi:hypothetical protein